jgi:hypothetical protein
MNYQTAEVTNNETSSATLEQIKEMLAQLLGAVPQPVAPKEVPEISSNVSQLLNYIASERIWLELQFNNADYDGATVREQTIIPRALMALSELNNIDLTKIQKGRYETIDIKPMIEKLIQKGVLFPAQEEALWKINSAANKIKHKLDFPFSIYENYATENYRAFQGILNILFNQAKQKGYDFRDNN